MGATHGRATVIHENMSGSQHGVYVPRPSLKLAALVFVGGLVVKAIFFARADGSAPMSKLLLLLLLSLPGTIASFTQDAVVSGTSSTDDTKAAVRTTGARRRATSTSARRSLAAAMRVGASLLLATMFAAATASQTVVEIAVGNRHSCARMQDNTLRCWGLNNKGQLGQGNTNNIGDTTDEVGTLAAIDLGSLRSAKRVSASLAAHTCVILDDDSLKCFGHGGSGRLGQDSTTDLGGQAGEPSSLTAINLGTGKTAAAVSTGGGHTCAILNDASLKCWGAGSDGRLGYGSTTDLGDGTSPAGGMAALGTVALGSGRSASAVACGGDFTCAILDDASVRCWGNGAVGRLGLGSTTSLSAPSVTAVALGIGRTATAIAAGSKHACAILDDSSLRCWGEAGHGRLGSGSTVDLLAPSATAVNLGTGKTATAVTAGAFHTCVLLNECVSSHARAPPPPPPRPCVCGARRRPMAHVLWSRDVCARDRAPQRTLRTSARARGAARLLYRLAAHRPCTAACTHGLTSS
jgi:hypothetical protein